MKFRFTTFITITTLLILINKTNGQRKEVMMEQQIINYILNGSNPDIRPEKEHGVPLHVHFEMKLQKIVRLDVKNQLFTINSFVRMRWLDPQLAWNKTKFEDIDKTNVGTSQIWTPDIVLYNSATEESFSHTDLYKTKALVFHTGKVVWTAPVTWQVSCEFDVTWFPIDRQICELTFGSWSYMATQMTLSFYDKNNDISDEKFSVRSGEWEIDNIEMTSDYVQYSCCPDPFSTIKYKFSMRRMVLYYFLYIILPLLSQVGLFFMVFHIPCENGERMGFGVTILLSITVYLLVISEKLPEKSDDIPMLGICFIIEFYILSLALVFAAIIVKLSNKTSPPPKFLLRVCGATKAVCCKRADAKTSPPMIEMHESNGYLHSEDDGARDFQKERLVLGKSKERDEKENKEVWRKICNALDRICFYVFGFLAVFAPIVVVAALDHTMLGV